VTALRAKNAKS